MTDELAGIFARFTEIPEMRDRDYVGNDGLIYCGTCGEPRQLLQPKGAIFPEDTKIKIMCACDRARLERQREEDARRELEAWRVRARDTAFALDSIYKTATFDRADATPVIQGAKKYVELYETDFKPNGTGLLLYGDTGTGKSYAAACIANALIDKGYKAIMTNIPRIVNRLQASFEGRNEYLDELANIPLLIIDDLKAERQTEYVMETTFSIIDSRYNTGLPMIITSNLTREQMQDQSAANSRLMSRISERCYPIEVKGSDRRKETGKSEYLRTKVLLGI